MSDWIASHLVRDDLPGFAPMGSQQTLEEALGRGSIPPFLQVYINHFAILVNSSPEIMLFAIDLYEDFIDEEGITIATMFSF